MYLKEGMHWIVRQWASSGMKLRTEIDKERCHPLSEFCASPQSPFLQAFQMDDPLCLHCLPVASSVSLCLSSMQRFLTGGLQSLQRNGSCCQQMKWICGCFVWAIGLVILWVLSFYLSRIKLLLIGEETSCCWLLLYSQGSHLLLLEKQIFETSPQQWFYLWLL